MAKGNEVSVKAREEFAAILPAVERWHEMAIRHSRIAIWCAACCGHELLTRKREIGHGGWMKFLDVLPFKRETARKYMELAEEWKERTGQITTGGGNLKPALLAGGSRAVLDLTDEQFTEIAEQTERTVGETTLRQLYFDWGICKPPHRPGGNMRSGDQPEPRMLTQEEISAAYSETWIKMVEALTEHGRRQKTHIHLGNGEIEAHREGLKRVVAELEEELKRRKTNGKA